MMWINIKMGKIYSSRTESRALAYWWLWEWIQGLCLFIVLPNPKCLRMHQPVTSFFGIVSEGLCDWLLCCCFAKRERKLFSTAPAVIASFSRRWRQSLELRLFRINEILKTCKTTLFRWKLLFFCLVSGEEQSKQAISIKCIIMQRTHLESLAASWRKQQFYARTKLNYDDAVLQNVKLSSLIARLMRWCCHLWMFL